VGSAPRYPEILAVNPVLHVGIDDTDSPSKGCTTYIAALLVPELLRLSCSFIDYPNLVRLNPNVPWKTRGNGAICLRLTCEESAIEVAVKAIVQVVERNSDLADVRADPAIAYLKGDVPAKLANFSKRAIRGLVTVGEAEEVAARHGVSRITIKGRKGFVGALAAVGEQLRSDHTYELIAYRTRQDTFRPRSVDPESVLRMDKETAPLTFNNVDPETNRILITPRGRDPILYGIRGETPSAVLQAHKIVKASEEIERWVIFRTNHGTDDHYSQASKISDIHPNQPAVLFGKVLKKPLTIPGGHVIFQLGDDSAAVDCAAYEPTGNFRNTVKKLVEGDLIEAYGGIRKSTSTHPRTLNLEKIRVVRLAQCFRYENPHCPNCHKRMESAGRGQGFRCRKCGANARMANRTPIQIERDLALGVYIPPARANRHLTKPILRYGREKTDSQIRLTEPWHWP